MAVERRDYLRAQRRLLSDTSGRFTTGEKRWLEYYWNRGSASHFTAALFEAITRADNGNVSRFMRGFPEEMHAYLEWTRGTLKNRVDAFIAEGEESGSSDQDED